MATTNLEITTLAPSQNNKTTTVNDGFQRIDTATQGVLDTAITAGSSSLTLEQFNTNFLLKFTGGFVGAYTVNIPTTGDRSFAVHNGNSGNLTLDLGSGASIIIPPHAAGEMTICHRDSAGATRVVAGSGGGTPYSETSATLDISSGNISLATTTPLFAGNYRFLVTGNNLSNTTNIEFPTGVDKIFMVTNTTTSNLLISVGASAYYVPPSQSRLCYSNGTIVIGIDNVEDIISYTNGLSFSILEEYFRQAKVIELTGNPATLQTITIPNGIKKHFVIKNTSPNATGGWQIKTTSGTAVNIGNLPIVELYSDGVTLTTLSEKSVTNFTSTSAFSFLLEDSIFRTYTAISLTGAPASTQTLTLPAGVSKYFTIRNASSNTLNWVVTVSGSSLTSTVMAGEIVTFLIDGVNAYPISHRTETSLLSTVIAGNTTLTLGQTLQNDIFVSTGTPGAAYTKDLQVSENSKLIGIVNNSSQAETFGVTSGVSDVLLPPGTAALAFNTGTDLIQLTKTRDYALPITITGNTTLTVNQFNAYNFFILSGTPAAFLFSTPTSQNIGTFTVVNATTVNCTVRAAGISTTEFILRPGNTATFFAIGTTLRLLAVTAINNQAWIPFTPTIIGATTNPTVTYTTQTGRYRYINGDKIEGFLRIVTSAYTAGTGDARIALTGLPNCNGTYRGRAILNDYAGLNGASIYKIGAVLPASAQIQLLTSSTSLIRIASNGLANPITLEANFEYSTS